MGLYPEQEKANIENVNKIQKYIEENVSVLIQRFKE